jgi:hypothetical protein
MGVTVFTDDGNGQKISDVLLDDGDIKMKLGKKVYLDSDLDTYFSCAADDVLDLYIAGSKDVIFKTNTIELQAATSISYASAIAIGYAPVYPIAVQQALSGAGAITTTEYYTAWTTTGADAGTLADGDKVGQMKKIQLIVDGGDGTLTPVSLSGGTTITFADAGDYAILMWDSSNWVAIEVGNAADGATAPVLA